MILSASQIRPSWRYSNNIRTGLCVYNSPVILYTDTGLMTEILSNYEYIYQDREAGPPKLLDNLNYNS